MTGTASGSCTRGARNQLGLLAEILNPRSLPREELLHDKRVGARADGIYTVLNHAPTAPRWGNRRFVQDFLTEYSRPPKLYNLPGWDAALPHDLAIANAGGRTPKLCNVTGWDAALLLDLAIAKAGPNPTGESINAAIPNVGQINSPRKQWPSSANHGFNDTFYLRQVRSDGRARANVVITTLNPQS